METHPHISFEIDLRELTDRHHQLFIEAYARCDELARYLPTLGSELYAEIERVYISKGIRASTAIEGSNLTEEETQELIAGQPDGQSRSQERADGAGDRSGGGGGRGDEGVSGRKGEGAPAVKEEKLEGRGTLPDNPLESIAAEKAEDRQMARNIQAVYEDIRKTSPAELSLDWLLRANKMVLAKLILMGHVSPGKIRTRPMKVGGYTAPPAKDCRRLLEKMLEWLNGKEFANVPLSATDLNADPSVPTENFARLLLKAILAHLYILHIHPFGDGNGRTARAAEVLVLTTGGLPAPVTQLFSDHYNATRDTYYNQLQQIQQGTFGGDGSPHDFILYAMEGFVAGLNELVVFVADEQIMVNRRINWEREVRESYSARLSPTEQRRIEVALSLPLDKPTPIAAIRSLSPQIAEMYGELTDKTVSRDVGSLARRGLIILLSSTPAVQPDPDLLVNSLELRGRLN